MIKFERICAMDEKLAPKVWPPKPTERLEAIVGGSIAVYCSSAPSQTQNMGFAGEKRTSQLEVGEKRAWGLAVLFGPF